MKPLDHGMSTINTLWRDENDGNGDDNNDDNHDDDDDNLNDLLFVSFKMWSWYHPSRVVKIRTTHILVTEPLKSIWAEKYEEKHTLNNFKLYTEQNMTLQ